MDERDLSLQTIALLGGEEWIAAKNQTIKVARRRQIEPSTLAIHCATDGESKSSALHPPQNTIHPAR